LEDREATQRREQEQKDAVGRAAARKQLRRTFTSGQFTVDAILVKIDGPNKKVDLLRADNKRTLTIDLDKLSESDRNWIVGVVPTVRRYGSAIAAEETKPAEP
jgi:phosphopantothenate synthetase